MSDLPERDRETYLGDGLYVSFDGWHLKLRAPRENGDHWIGLEPEIYQELRRWIAGYPKLQQHLERG